MAFEMWWHIEGYVVYERLYGTLTIEDVQQLARMGQKYTLAAEREPLHFIADVSDLERVAIKLGQVRTAKLPIGHSASWTVIVGASNPVITYMARMLSLTLSSVFNFRFQIFRSCDEGVAFLCKADPIVASILSDEPIP